jgi:anti-sigma-K factor RskA
VDTPMSHSEYEELAAGYVLGALEPDDEHLFQQHLGGCPVCEANVRELEAVVGELAYAVPPVEPPDTLWAGIRREIRPEAARRTMLPAPPAGAEGRPGAGAGGRGLRLLPGLAAAAAIVVVVVLSLWNLNLRDENAVYRERVAALERATELANDPNASLVSLDDAPGPEGAQATVIASSREDRGVLIVENLPPLQRNRVYELWGVPQGDIAKAEKALVFQPLRRQGVQTLEFEVPVQPGTQFAITEEPGPDGSEKPTTQPILAGAPPTA